MLVSFLYSVFDFDIFHGNGGRLSQSVFPEALRDGLDDPPVHVRARVLGQQLEDEPVADVAPAQEVVDHGDVLNGECAKTRPETSKLRHLFSIQQISKIQSIEKLVKLEKC